MKKTMRILLIIVVSALAVLSIKPVLNFCGNLLWDYISYDFDKAQAERDRIYEEGGIVVGRDTMLVWKDMYVIMNAYEGDTLEIHVGKDDDRVILRGVVDYKVKKDKLYVVSREGFAVIDKNGKCRAYLTTPVEAQFNGYIEDENGEVTYYSQRVEHPYVRYVFQYSSYTEEERKVFNKILYED